MNSVKLQYKKISTQKSLTFLDTNNERADKETKEAISFTIASKRISLLEITLPMEEKDLYSENCKILKKDDKEISRWKDISCSWIGRVNIVKMTILPKAICRHSVISFKSPMAFFTESEQKFYNLYGNTKGLK